MLTLKALEQEVRRLAEENPGTVYEVEEYQVVETKYKKV